MKKILSILVLGSVVFTSCKKEETADAPPIEEVVATEAAAPTAGTAATDAQQTVQPAVNAAQGTGSVMTNPQVNAQSYTTTAAPQATAKGMNPPHGQPGHRCEIPVGAPLNSAAPKKAAAANTTTQSTTITPAMLQQNGTIAAPGANVTTTTTSNAPSPIVTAPGMNPPHGQEGHVCSIPVGDPLPKN